MPFGCGNCRGLLLLDVAIFFDREVSSSFNFRPKVFQPQHGLPFFFIAIQSNYYKLWSDSYDLADNNRSDSYDLADNFDTAQDPARCLIKKKKKKNWL